MMAKFVLAYNRPGNRIEVFETYSDTREAVRRRIELEESYDGAEWEVALLASDSEESLRATHSRYFASETSAA